ncbi:MAG TPA: methyltransferase domain-containing protein [Casimicrobiaceae bacterium]|nr:methyltransferase domain-containing protein [Casimicrobiaceae bacterium]
MTQNSATSDFWETRYRSDATPWDAGRPPPMLSAFLAREPAARVLVPGCGSGHDVRAFAEAGWQVTGIDFSPAAVERAQRNAGRFANRIELGDFFRVLDGEPRWSVIYERTFLCALPRSRWPDYAGKMAALLPSGGRLLGFYFFDDEPKGPPFGLLPGEQEGLLGDAFALVDDVPVPAVQSVPVLAGKERWQVWRRK